MRRLLFGVQPGILQGWVGTSLRKLLPHPTKRIAAGHIFDNQPPAQVIDLKFNSGIYNDGTASAHAGLTAVHRYELSGDEP